MPKRLNAYTFAHNTCPLSRASVSNAFSDLDIAAYIQGNNIGAHLLCYNSRILFAVILSIA